MTAVTKVTLIILRFNSSPLTISEWIMIIESRTIIYKFSETFFSHDVAVPVPGGHGGGPDGSGPAAASPRPAAEPRAALPRPRPRQPRLSQVIFLD